MWALRCVHESKLHEAKCFITLTYDDKHLPEGNTLVKSDLQKFFKRLRKKCGSFRYFACGEYGEKGLRPHYHAIIFGLSFQEDRKKLSTNGRGDILYYSKTLTETWQNGHATVGSFTYATAAYTARYILKKIGGEHAHNHYYRADPRTGQLSHVVPEFACMSLKPGIGYGWWEKYKADAFPSDFLTHEGKRHVVPRYYTNLFKKENENGHKQIIAKRKREMKRFAHDNTPDRLAVKEEVLLSKLSTLKRSL